VEVFCFDRMVCDDKVRMLSAPFEGLEGVFDKPDGDVRAIVFLDFLGKSSHLSIDKTLISNDT